VSILGSESDHKKSYQEYMKEKITLVVIHKCCHKNMFFIKYAIVIYVAMCCQSLATLGCMHILAYNIIVH
jgi:hypothetical protein